MTVRSMVRRVVAWPVFLALAAVHIVVLPAVLSEREDDIAAVLAGVAYLALAIADLASRRRHDGGGHGGGLRTGPPRRPSARR